MRSVFWVVKLPAALAECAAAVATTVIAELAAWAVFFRASQANANRATVELFAVKLIYSFLVVRFVDEFNETKTFGAAAVAVRDNTGASNFTNLLKVSLQTIIGSCVSKAADKKILLCHKMDTLFFLLVTSDRPCGELW